MVPLLVLDEVDVVLLVHVVVERLGLAQDGPLAEEAGVKVPHGDLVAVGGALEAIV